jgi:hypothetical protein
MSAIMTKNDANEEPEDDVVFAEKLGLFELEHLRRAAQMFAINRDLIICPDGYVMSDGNCIVCAIVNRRMVYRDRRLRVVIGSLGVCGKNPFSRNEQVFYMYGDTNFKTVDDFITATGNFDVHVWLEDSDGRVYDYLSRHVVKETQKLLRKTKKIASMKRGTRLVGLTKAKTRQCYGLCYVPAAIDVQAAITARYAEVYGRDAIDEVMLRVQEEMKLK